MRRLSDKLRNEVKTHLQNGDAVCQVADKLNISISAVSKIGKKVAPERVLSKGGRPQRLAEANKRYCVHLVTRGRVDNAVKVAKKLEEDLGIKVSTDTVRRALRSKGVGAFEKQKYLH